MQSLPSNFPTHPKLRGQLSRGSKLNLTVGAVGPDASIPFFPSNQLRYRTRQRHEISLSIVEPGLSFHVSHVGICIAVARWEARQYVLTWPPIPCRLAFRVVLEMSWFLTQAASKDGVSVRVTHVILPALHVSSAIFVGNRLAIVSTRRCHRGFDYFPEHPFGVLFLSLSLSFLPLLPLFVRDRCFALWKRYPFSLLDAATVSIHY